MKKFVRSWTVKTKITVFALLYIIVLAFAVLPPLYLWGSGRTALFLGAPMSVWYWLFDFLALLIIMGLLYWVEDVRGEVDPEEDAPADTATLPPTSGTTTAAAANNTRTGSTH
ncbi:MAG: hypothetical protein PUF51_03855 [Bifidobacteriaceae bacterium]|nr:hypothetical protein [Bifidobacteriaceae bacterium]